MSTKVLKVKGHTVKIRVLRKKGVCVDIRSPKSILRRFKIGSILDVQYELTTMSGETCFWLSTFGSYIYFPEDSYHIEK